MNLTVLLLVTVAVVFACVLLNNFSARVGIPSLLAFIMLGMLFGSDGIFKINFDNYAFAERICSTALIFIMFYGGFGINWEKARKKSVSAFTLASLGVVATALFTGLFLRFVFHFEWYLCFLLASVVSSTDAASVFSILRSRRLNLKYGTASILEMESGSNDPASYLMMLIFTSLMSGQASAPSIVRLVVLQLFIGIAGGILIALGAIFLLKKVHFADTGFDIVFVFGVALFSYAMPTFLGGNGYLAAYIAGIIIGNAQIPGKQRLVYFFDGATDICQMLIFFLLGLLAFPSRLPAVAGISLALSAFMFFIARPLAVFLIGKPFGMPMRQILTISFAGLRGAASIVFAIMVMTRTDTDQDVFHIVFLLVLVSILVQGSLLPAFCRKMDMLDANEDVMKTFNDYTSETPVEFIRVRITKENAWVGHTLREITLPPSTLAVMIDRGGERIVPNGATVLQDGDQLILAADSANQDEVLRIVDRDVEADSPMVGKPLKEMPRSKGLVIMVQRDGQTFIPNGDTVICAGDHLVIHSERNH